MIKTIRTGKLFNDQHPNNYRDWVIGSYVQDSSFNSDDFEFKWQHNEKGHFREPKEVLNPDTKSLAVLVYGKVRMKFINTDEEHYIENEGDYIVWSSDEPHEVEFMEDTLIITLRWKN